MRIEHLTKRYRTVTAVDGLSFEVGPGRGHRLPGTERRGILPARTFARGLAVSRPCGGTRGIMTQLPKACMARQLSRVAGTRCRAPAPAAALRVVMGGSGRWSRRRKIDSTRSAWEISAWMFFGGGSRHGDLCRSRFPGRKAG